MLLRRGEKVIKEGEAGADYEAVRGVREATKGSLGKGNLFLTNERIVYEVKHGFLSKKVTTAIDVGLDRVTNVGVEGLFGKKLAIQLPVEVSSKVAIVRGQEREIEAKVFFKVKDPEAWKDAVIAQVSGV